MTTSHHPRPPPPVPSMSYRCSTGSSFRAAPWIKCAHCKGAMVTPVWPTLNVSRDNPVNCPHPRTRGYHQTFRVSFQVHTPLNLGDGLQCNGCSVDIVSDPRERSKVTGDSRMSQGSKALVTKKDYASAIAVCPDCFTKNLDSRPLQECYCATCIAAKKPFWRKLPLFSALKLAVLVAVLLVIRHHARRAGGLLKLLQTAGAKRPRQLV